MTQDEMNREVAVGRDIADADTLEAARKEDGSLPSGCADCSLSTFRFNGGNGATTCGALRERIVAYGHRVPETRPAECPLGPSETRR